MKKIPLSFFILIFFLTITHTFADNTISIKILPNVSVSQDSKKELTRADVFNYFGDYFDKNIKDSYKYINLNFRGLEKDSELYKSFQKLIYLNLLENKNIFINKDKTISVYEFYKLAEQFLSVKLIDENEISDLKNKNTTFGNFKDLEKRLSNLKYKIPGINTSDSKEVEFKKDIFSDVYKILQTSHYNKNNLDDGKLLDGAIQGLADSSEDKYTTYFPPAENKSFNEALTGEYEGIGTYVEMKKPGEVVIVSPISGTPSEKAGLQGGDIIVKVDDKEILKDTSLDQTVSWIKGPAGTSVKLTIKRGNNILSIDVIRRNIIIKDIEYKKIDNSTFYIDIRFFGPNIADDFKKVLEDLKAEKNINKIIIDLRNNPGGYLDQVTDMLSYIVPAGENTAVVKYSNGFSSPYVSSGYDLIDFSKYKIVIIQNSGSASASEIMIATIKDYFPKTSLVGENTYGKGSVQTIKEYKDGSSLKYTIAKWFSGKTETGIDGVGIKPDYEVLVDKYIKDEPSDPQLNKAKSIY